ncbi:hypothetical protein bmyco0002_48880 [Bacillus pseudomycoides]|nr:hypothetical protein bmyco0002_48880 [Bacillus pseudomycoides]
MLTLHEYLIQPKFRNTSFLLNDTIKKKMGIYHELKREKVIDLL